jgi:hypothetical protein
MEFGLWHRQLLWLALFKALDTLPFNFSVVRSR